MNSMGSNKPGLDLMQMDVKSLKVSKTDMFFPNGQQFRDSCLPQEFFFPVPIMKYIWENPSSPEVYHKLIKSCKLFFVKNPILVLRNLDYNDTELGNGWEYCDGIECFGSSSCSHKHERIDVDGLHSKIWITNQFSAFTSEKSNLVSAFISKIFRLNIFELGLFYQELSYDELKYLASGVKEISLGDNIIKYGNGEDVPLEGIIKVVSGARRVWTNVCSAPTNIDSYDDFFDACKTVQNVILFSIPNDVDVPHFYQHLKRCKNRCAIEISADHDYERREDLDEIINEILATKSFDFVPPVINHSELSYSKVEMMEKIQSNEAAKYC